MRVDIYTKPRCSLCDEAKRTLEQVRARVPFELREINIEEDPALHAAYRYDVPVVLVDGHKAFKHRLDPAAVEARLVRARDADGAS